MSTGVHKQDVEEVIKTGMSFLRDKYGDRFRFRSLANGYRRFEPVRGMEYKIDLLLFDTVSSETSVARLIRLEHDRSVLSRFSVVFCANCVAFVHEIEHGFAPLKSSRDLK